ncbi:MAG: DUF1552 domain-containing protein, partial [Pseudomonadota bacterium]
DPETFWPTKTGALTKASMDADAPTQTTGLLSDYATRLLLVRGIGHPFVGAGCDHAAGDAQLLTAAKLVGTSNKTVAGGESIDSRIAREKNPPGREPLVLHAGKYSPGGTGYDIPGYVSYIAASQPRAYIDGPYKAYQKIIGVVGTGGTATDPAAMQAQQLLANRSKSVNDILRSQITTLLARKDLSSGDINRLNQHFAAIRDIEVKMTSSTVATLPAAAVTSAQAIDPNPYDIVNHETLIKLHMQLMAFAMAADYSRVAVLKIGDREDDHSLTIGGTTFVYHTASHRTIANGAELCRQVDRMHAGYFKFLLDQLSSYTTPTGTMLDQGITVWTNQVANGAHSFKKVPWLLCGTGNGYLKTGQFLDVGAVNGNLMLNTLLNATGVRKTGGALVDDFGDTSLAKGVATPIVA